MNQLSTFTWMSICTKMKTNRVHTSLSPNSNCRRSSLLLFTCVARIIWNENQAPITGDRWILQQALQKRRRTTNIFGVFEFKIRTKGNKQTKQNIFGIYLDIKPKLKLSKLILNTKERNKEKPRKYFGSFCVLRNRNKQQTTKRKKENRNMDIQSTDKIWYVNECDVGVPPPKLRLLA